MTKVTEIKPRDLNEEFPGLDSISRKVFDVSYADATPNLREHVRIIAKRDAAEAMYQQLQKIISIQCLCEVGKHADSCPVGQSLQVIRKAEGRV
jgi:hypothetical protein